ncbi:MAG: HYR domain-containing protein [Acidobacteria bacterium]|nr:HYR domain-containing protein [Acidobacteriota bacterium]
MKKNIFRLAIYLIAVSFALLILPKFFSAYMTSSSSKTRTVPERYTTATALNEASGNMPEPKSGRGVKPLSARVTTAAAMFAATVTASKTVSPASAAPGATLTYTVTIADSGMDATALALNDTIDTNTTLVAGSVKATPVAVNDSYTATGNVQITIPAGSGVLVNDFLGIPTATITASDTTSAQGGTVAVNADGSFTYNPPRGYEGTDTFTYTLSNTQGSNVGTVTFTVTGMIWFINNTAGACSSTCDGRLTNPYTTLAAFQAVNNGTGNNPAANDNIFLYTGTSNYTGPITLLSGQKLIGQGATASLSSITGLTPPTGSLALPATSGTRPVIAAAVTDLTLSSGNTIRGFNISNTGGTALTGSTVGNLSASEIAITNTNGGGVNLNGGNPTATFNSINTTGGANGISLQNLTGSFTVLGDGGATNNGSGGTIQTTTSHGVLISNATNITLGYMNITNSGNGAGGDVNADGINGVTLNGLTLTRCNVTDNAGDSGVNAQGVSLSGAMNGTYNITNCTLGPNRHDNLQVRPTSGTITAFNITGGTITGSVGNSGLNFNVAVTTVVTALNITSTTISNNFADGMQIDAADTSIITLATIDSCTFTGNNIAMDVDNSQNGVNKFKIINNNFQNQHSSAINVFAGGTGGGVDGKILNNTIGTNNTKDSGSAIGNAIRLNINEQANGKIQVDGNQIHEVPNARVIEAIGRLGTGGANFIITNNTITVPTGTNQTICDGSTTTACPLAGIYVEANTGNTVCARVTGNVVNYDPSAFPGGFGGEQSIRVRQTGAPAGIFNLEQGFAALATNNTVVNTGQSGTINTVAANSCTGPTVAIVEEQNPPPPAALTLEPQVLERLEDTLYSEETAWHKAAAPVELSTQELNWMVQAAIARLSALGLSATDATRLQNLQFEVAKLEEGIVAKANLQRVLISSTADNYGWFVDPTPERDEQYKRHRFESDRVAKGSPALGKLDLLTALMREMVFVLGSEKGVRSFRNSGLMQVTLPPNTRRLPGVEDNVLIETVPVLQTSTGFNKGTQTISQALNSRSMENLATDQSAFFSTSDLTNRLVRVQASGENLRPVYAALYKPNAATPVMMSGETVTVTVGTLPVGKNVVITFQATINTPFPTNTCQVSNQGTVSGSNFSNVLTDDPGVAGTANPTVTAITIPPVIGACPTNITGNTDANLCTRVTTFTTPTATGCPVPTVTCSPASGFAFAKGVTTVTCTASNTSGPDSTCTFTVTVNDNQAPVFANCTNITTNTALNLCTANVTYTTTLNDNCPGQTFSCVPASGSTFAKGVTTVNCTGSDAAGNPATPCSFTVTVNDNQAPTLTCPANVTTSTDAGVCTAVVTYANATAADNCPGVGTPSCSPASGTAFSKGVTTVTCNVMDAAGNAATPCSFTVTVNDTEAPKSCVTPPANMISWWSGDGNANDIQGVSPNNNNGSGGAFAAGKVGQAFTFSGSTLVSAPNSASLNLTGTAVTIDGWINPNSNATDAVYFGKTSSGANDYLLLYQFSNISAIIKTGTTETILNTGVSPTVGVWTHIALVYNGTDMRVYVNGVLTGGATAKTGNLAGSNVPFSIGGRSGGLFFNGLIDEVEVFGRALSAAEILSIYNAGSFGKCKPVVVNNTSGQCSATNTYTNPTFTDNCTGGSIVCAPLANTTFPVGTTTVSCTVTDASSNTYTNSFEVRVVDNQAPTLTCPTNVTTNTAAGVCTAVVTYTTPTASDNCTGATVSCSPASGSTFNKGVTTVTCTATDAAGLTGTCTFTVTVNDNQNPTISCPVNITQSTDSGVCTAVVTYTTPTAADNCPGVGTVTCTPASGATFNKGVTTVSCSVTDASSNPGSCTFTVTVNDTQNPTLGACPANQNVSTAGGCVNVSYTPPTVSDNCTGATVSCSPASGTCFAVGTTTVTCTGTDTSSNTASCSFTVTVTPCTITCPANVTTPADSGQCTAVVSYSAPTTAGTCGTVTCSPASGAAFPKGITTVTCSTSVGPSCTFTVTVNDTQNPTLTCPANITQNADSGVCTAVVNFTTPTASDNCTGATVSCSPASGATFNQGVTTVTCTATDTSNNTAQCMFTVTVNDTQAPTVSCPANITQNADSGVCTAVVTYTTPTASDNCTGATVSCSPASGSTFNKGVTTVTCTATDAASLTGTCTFTVTVNDTQNPTITCPANITQSTDSGVCTAVVTYAAPTVADNCTGVGTPSCSPSSGSAFPKGTTTVTCSVTDASSNSASCTFTVTVNDTQNPTITCPANVNVVSNVCVSNPYTPPTASDNCPGVTVNCVPPPSTCFAVGTTTVTCTATDASNNTASCSFTVSVIPCTITCPANITRANDPNQCGAVVTFAPMTTGSCGTVSCSPASGSFFALGTTTVSCTTSAGPSCAFTVTVMDTQPPTLTCAANQTRAALRPGDAAVVVNYPAPTVTDNCAGTAVVCTPPSGSVMALGVTTVSCTASDTVGNTASCSFTVTVYDVCLQDDGGSTTIFFNTHTGDYRFCCNGAVFSGKGSVVRSGNTWTLTHYTSDRRVLSRVDANANSGTGSLQSPPGVSRCSFSDRDFRNNACQCQ